MIYTIENDKIKLNISDIGAEMMNIIYKKNGTEYLWQGDEKYWSDRAINLFPICSRLTDDKYTYRGKEYKIGLHGFVRHTVLDVEDIQDDRITFILRANDETRKVYPFEFIFRLTYILDETRIKNLFSVENVGDEALYYAVGGHPGFNVPLNEGEKFEDYYLEFDTVEPAELFVLPPYTGKTVPYPMTDGKIIELSHDLFPYDGSFFKNMSHAITLKSRKSSSFVRVEYDDMSFVGIWHAPKTDAPYICIEPWTSFASCEGIVDDLETKFSMIKLNPGCKKDISFDIIIG